jgi:hypothetical protein
MCPARVSEALWQRYPSALHTKEYENSQAETVEGSTWQLVCLLILHGALQESYHVLHHQP